jgi:heme-degrading monooxygenase HmoA
MIKHAVIFKLKHARNSAAEKKFMNAAMNLAAIPGVTNFECLRQVSPKNKFDYGLAMVFASEAAYHAYSNHPAHVQFIELFWLKDVEDFLEIDFEEYNG